MGTGPNSPMTASAICYDFAAVSRFFRSVAVAVAFQQHTSLEWVEYKDSAVLNAVYTLCFWKEGPGTVEVKTGKPDKIQMTVDRLHLEFVTIWIDRLHSQGPAAANRYVDTMFKLREGAREAVQDMFRSANEINAEIVNGVNEAIGRLAKIKLASQVGVAVIGAAGAIVIAGGAAVITVAGSSMAVGGSAMAFTGVSLANSFALSTIKNWEGGSTAKAVAIDMSVEGGKTAVGEGLSAAASRTGVKALEQITHSDQVIRSAEGQINKYSQKLAQEGLKKSRYAKARSIIHSSRNVVARETGKIAQANRYVSAAKGLGKAVPVVFAAIDILSAFSDYQETMETIR